MFSSLTKKVGCISNDSSQYHPYELCSEQQGQVQPSKFLKKADSSLGLSSNARYSTQCGDHTPRMSLRPVAIRASEGAGARLAGAGAGAAPCSMHKQRLDATHAGRNACCMGLS